MISFLLNDTMKYRYTSVGTFRLLFFVTASKQEKARCDTVQRDASRTVIRCNTRYLLVKNGGLRNKAFKKIKYLFIIMKELKKKKFKKKNLRHAIF